MTVAGQRSLCMLLTTPRGVMVKPPVSSSMVVVDCDSWIFIAWPQHLQNHSAARPQHLAGALHQGGDLHRVPENGVVRDLASAAIPVSRAIIDSSRLIMPLTDFTELTNRTGMLALVPTTPPTTLPLCIPIRNFSLAASQKYQNRRLGNTLRPTEIQL